MFYLLRCTLGDVVNFSTNIVMYTGLHLQLFIQESETQLLIFLTDDWTRFNQDSYIYKAIEVLQVLTLFMGKINEATSGTKGTQNNTVAHLSSSVNFTLQPHLLILFPLLFL